MKCCNRCSKVKSFRDFHRNKRQALIQPCRECRNQERKERYLDKKGQPEIA